LERACKFIFLFLVKLWNHSIIFIRCVELNQLDLGYAYRCFEEHVGNCPFQESSLGG
jgi:hypothetical protein